MTTFPLTPTVKYHISRPLSELFPAWRVTDVHADNDTLYVRCELTPEDVAAINAMIANLDDAIQAEKQKRRHNMNTFGWMQGKQAKQWKQALDPKRRTA